MKIKIENLSALLFFTITSQFGLLFLTVPLFFLLKQIGLGIELQAKLLFFYLLFIGLYGILFFFVTLGVLFFKNIQKRIFFGIKSIFMSIILLVLIVVEVFYTLVILSEF